jgi:hypothetical protein
VTFEECDQVHGRNRTVLLPFGKDEPAGILFKWWHEELSLQEPSLAVSSRHCVQLRNSATQNGDKKGPRKK